MLRFGVISQNARNILQRQESLPLSDAIKLTVDSTCESYGEYLDESVLQGLGKFLDVCPVYNKAPSFYQEMLQSYASSLRCEVNPIIEKTQLNNELMLFESTMRLALDGLVFKNVLELKNACWECGQVPSSGTLLWCAGCDVAFYCRRSCQKKAWRSGHKEHCEKLPEHFQLFQKNYQLHAHPTSGLEIKEGVIISLYNRCSVFFNFISNPPSMIVDDWIPIGPSLEVFYRNLKSIAAGDFWFFRNAGTLDSYMRKIKKCTVSERQLGETKIRNKVFQFISYEFEDKETGVVAESTLSEDSPYYLYLNHYARRVLLPMPVERFFQLCNDSHGTDNQFWEDLEKRRSVWDKKTVSLYHFRRWAHKGAADVELEKSEKNLFCREI